MKPSANAAIVQCLMLMAAQDSDIEVRRFEKDGVEKLSLLIKKQVLS